VSDVIPKFPPASGAKTAADAPRNLGATSLGLETSNREMPTRLRVRRVAAQVADVEEVLVWIERQGIRFVGNLEGRAARAGPCTPLHHGDLADARVGCPSGPCRRSSGASPARGRRRGLVSTYVSELLPRTPMKSLPLAGVALQSMLQSWRPRGFVSASARFGQAGSASSWNAMPR